jgi:Tfp pilus assembly protein PilZ
VAIKAEPGSPARNDASGTLRAIRIPFIQRAELTVGAETEPLFLVDLGLNGAFAERAAALPVGASVTLRFTLPGNEIPLTFTCRVAWWHAPGAPLVSKALPAGVGLEFVEWSEDDQRRLRRYLEAYLQRSAGRRFHRPLPLADDGEDR